MNLQEALEAPRFTKTRATGCDVTIESRVGLATLQQLSAMGHQITIAQPYSARMGRGNAVMHNARTKVNTGASDPRADGAAIPQAQ
jgi:gamma-glutamyltranspeptidase/glutathione hydrolase